MAVDCLILRPIVCSLDIGHTDSMHDFSINPHDEEGHQSGSQRFWSESWYFDFFDATGQLGGYLRIGLYPNLGATWYWACLVGADRPLVAVVEHDLSLPELPSLALANSNLNADAHYVAANGNFAVNLSAKAGVYSNPADIYANSVLQTTTLSFDLEWHTDGQGYRFRDLERYELPCEVSGEIRVGDEQIDFKGFGQRDHSWGERNWWENAWCWNSGRLDDGSRFHSVAPRTLDGVSIPWAAGYIQSPDKHLIPIQLSLAEEKLGDHGFPTQGWIEADDLKLSVTPLYFAPLRLVDPDGRVSHFVRALVRYSCADGRDGLGWIEWNQPQLKPATPD